MNKKIRDFLLVFFIPIVSATLHFLLFWIAGFRLNNKESVQWHIDKVMTSYIEYFRMIPSAFDEGMFFSLIYLSPFWLSLPALVKWNLATKVLMCIGFCFYWITPVAIVFWLNV